ncbi:RluA family pseudouridine synthase [Savagea sp. SN6]|uniref:Pseudouridine synthase n=1 Tax=Savagea serpentis TaxID=2785297 RepID=A0A8J7GLC2_9BACL|nr:RluA family pseudouridine synthase [Savagea serpentis]MBF4502175.1 RluA family pseudouridine synthase [Savagea serpentis]
MNIPIIYEDNHLLVVEKVPNLPVQEDASGDQDMLTILKADLKERYNKPGNVYLGLVHRLDRPVGGAMVFAKTSKAASRLSDTLRKRDMERTYIAVVHGRVKQQKGTLEHYLWKDRQKNEVYAVDSKKKDAKKAILHYEVIGREEGYTMVRVKLETGRSHQIRVQFQTIGHPLHGDQKYGGLRVKKGEQIALWSSSLSFPHPTTKEIVTFEAPLPKGMPWNLFD